MDYDREPERYYDWMLWKMRQERKKETMSGETLDINDDGLVTGIHPSPYMMQDQLREEALVDARRKQMDNKSSMIWVTFQKEGIHKYPAALDDPKLATGGWDDVSFLGYPHRHIFKFRVSIEVFHNDRDIEFIQFKRWLQRLYDMAPDGGEGHSNTKVLELDYKSCEMISDELFEKIAERYPERSVHIEVSEDGENGCFIKYDYGKE
tara:strand:+ start:612 stop:1232 length:621 start_codon:yes stop_codon:yes gene_type:complete